MDTLIGIEHVSGTRFDDVLTGDGGDNWIWGGSDSSGVTGNDILSGGGGNDLIEVGAGNHILDGGTGNDTLSLFGNGTDITAAGVTVSLLLQGAAQDTEQGMMVLAGFENLSGSIYADSLTGDGNDNVLAGDHRQRHPRRRRRQRHALRRRPDHRRHPRHRRLGTDHHHCRRQPAVPASARLATTSLKAATATTRSTAAAASTPRATRSATGRGHGQPDRRLRQRRRRATTI